MLFLNYLSKNFLLLHPFVVNFRIDLVGSTIQNNLSLHAKPTVYTYTRG